MSYLLVRRYAAASVFYILSVLLFPVTLLGYVIWIGKGLLTWSASGVSGTAQGPLSALVRAQSGHQARRAGRSADDGPARHPAVGLAPGIRPHTAGPPRDRLRAQSLQVPLRR